MIKRFFSSPDAVQWLSKERQSPITESDLTREAAAYRLPVCFHYRGFLAVYSSPPADSSSVALRLFPKALSRHYVDGYLRSKSPVQLNTRIDRFRSRRGPEGKLLVSESTTYEDTLTPCEVEVVELIWADPPMPVLGPDQFLGRCGSPGDQLVRTPVHRDDWLFSAAGLLALVAANTSNAKTEPSASVAARGARGDKPKETLEERNARILARHAELKKKNVLDFNKVLAEEFGLSTSAIKQIRRSSAQTSKAAAHWPTPPFNAQQKQRKMR